MAIPKRAAERIAGNLKKYQAILAEARNRDISESDTVVIVADMLADLLGYRKYVEITTEFAIRGTYVDLAIKLGEEVRFLIEAKAIGVELKDAHVKQAIDYGANQGIEWIILTNGATWRIYKIHFKQPVDKSLVYEFDLLQASTKSDDVLDCLGNLSREGFTQSSMAAFHQQQQATGKFSLAAVLLSDGVVGSVRRELRRLYPSVKVDEETIRAVLQNEVMKREVVDSDDAKIARDTLKRAQRSADRAKAKAASADRPTPGPDVAPSAPTVEISAEPA